MLKRSSNRFLRQSDGFWTPCRRHVASRSGQQHDTTGDLIWPKPAPFQRLPTPYQILRQKPDGVYSKHVFCRLVKVYHPDRREHNSDAVSQATMLERYHLIVAAHEILSHPVSRAAYDRNGAGWEDRNGPVSRRPTYPKQWKYAHDRRDVHHPFANATWEDWAQWHKRREESQSPSSTTHQYTSNGAFVGFMVAFAVLGALLQSMRFGKHTASVFASQDELHEQMSKDLVQRRCDLRERDERIDAFLRERGVWASVQLEREGIPHERQLEAPQVSLSEQIQRRKG